jgi:UDP-N-acetylglucosamine 2-epimerase (non-hydrolysing)
MGLPRIAMVVGTRPEAIKMVPVYLAAKRIGLAKVFLIATAQHRAMLDQVLALFGIKPDLDLDLMRPDQSLSNLTSLLVGAVHRAITEVKADLVLVQGDTTTSLGSALAAFYAGVPIGHVEAGLRTYDFTAPWPEEMNRRVVDVMSHWCFAPTSLAVENLRAERIPEKNIFLTGNTVVDALLLARDMIRDQDVIIPGLTKDALSGKRVILVTGHRRESFGKSFEDFCFALREIARAHPDTLIVYPVHLNPNVQEPVYRILSTEDRILLIPPLEYLPFVSLMDHSYIIITDSGGIQEEASSLGKPTLVTRKITERKEAINAGVARLVGTDREGIATEASRLLTDCSAYAEMSRGQELFGDGRSAERILGILRSTL